MIPYIRRQKILDEINKGNIVYLKDLCKLFPSSSISTIRRDLHILSEHEHVTLLQGGAVKLRSSSSYDAPFIRKQSIRIDEKRLMAKFAANLVHTGETIYIDSGTTTGEIITYLSEKHITVVTSNTKIIEKIEKTPFTCILLGGEINKALGSVQGGITNSILSSMYFDCAFLGASGYSEENGINTPDFSERDKKRLVYNKSKKTYVLLDSSKAGVNTTCKIFELDQCTIITEKKTELLEKNSHYIVAK